MSNTISLLFDYFTLPKAHVGDARISGSTLFHDEYPKKNQYLLIKDLFTKFKSNPIVRVPFPPDIRKWSQFFQCIRYIQAAGCTPLVLFDCFYDDASMKKRITKLKSTFGQLIYFELFNELPWLHYTGQQMTSLDDLIAKTNQYTALIRQLFPKAKILSMAPANILMEMDYADEWGGDNITQLKRLAFETTTDLVNIHMYADSWRKKARFKGLMRTLEEIKDRTGKDCWVTEIGADAWRDHVEIFEQWCSRAMAVRSIKEIIWYRQAILLKNIPDGGFALHEINTNNKSPLCHRVKE